jgi:hypothetical protein
MTLPIEFDILIIFDPRAKPITLFEKNYYAGKQRRSFAGIQPFKNYC